MVKVIAVGASKGGVGKTTIATNLAQQLANMKNKARDHGKNNVLFINFDTQVDGAEVFVHEINPDVLTTSNLLLDKKLDLSKLFHLVEENLHVVVQDNNIKDSVATLVQRGKYHNVLKKAIHDTAISIFYDYVIIDMPAGSADSGYHLGLVAADLWVMPIQYHISSLNGVNNLVSHIKTSFTGALKKEIPELLIVPNMVDKRSKSTNDELHGFLESGVGDKLSEPIRSNATFKNASNKRITAIKHDELLKQKRLDKYNSIKNSLKNSSTKKDKIKFTNQIEKFKKVKHEYNATDDIVSLVEKIHTLI